MKKGFILIPSIIIMAVLLIVSLFFSENLFSELNIARNQKKGTLAFYIAEAGLEKAQWNLNQPGNTYTGETNTAFGGGKFTTVITDNGLNQKSVTSTGYYPQNDPFQAKRTVSVNLIAGTGQVVAFSYAIQAGSGGVDMSGNALVDPGSLYSNGNISLSNNNYVSGDAYSVGTVNSPTCDHVLKKGICGNIVEGAPILPLPVIDYDYWIAEAQKGGSIANYNGTPSTIGPQEILGNFEVTGGTVTITGPLYIHGNVKISGGATIKIDDSFGSDSVFVVVDGTIDISGGSVFQPTSSTPPGPEEKCPESPVS